MVFRRASSVGISPRPSIPRRAVISTGKRTLTSGSKSSSPASAGFLRADRQSRSARVRGHRRERRTGGSDSRSTPEPVMEPTPVPPVEEPVAEQPPVKPQFFSDPMRLAGWIGLAIVAITAVAGIAVFAAWFAGLRGLSPVSSLYARALRAGSWLGAPSSPSMTPREFADHVGRLVPSAQSPARIVADVYTQERYAGQRPSDEALRSARAAWSDLRRITLGGFLRRNRNGSQR